MTERLTSSQIQTRIEQVISLHPGCRGFHVEVKVRRMDHEKAAHHDWGVDFYATGDIEGRDACEEALQEILDDALEDYALSLDS